jgi:crossover junction endodeoxyribonuclease RuvC
MPGMPGTDAADALGIAICHAHSRETLTLIAGGTSATNGPLAGCACAVAGWLANI